MSCPSCFSSNVKKDGLQHTTGKQQYKCRDCGRRFQGKKDITSKAKKTLFKGLKIDDLINSIKF